MGRFSNETQARKQYGLNGRPMGKEGIMVKVKKLGHVAIEVADVKRKRASH